MNNFNDIYGTVETIDINKELENKSRGHQEAKARAEVIKIIENQLNRSVQSIIFNENGNIVNINFCRKL